MSYTIFIPYVPYQKWRHTLVLDSTVIISYLIGYIPTRAGLWGGGEGDHPVRNIFLRHEEMW